VTTLSPISKIAGGHSPGSFDAEPVVRSRASKFTTRTSCPWSIPSSKRHKTTDVWLSVSAYTSVTRSAGTLENSRTVSVGPSHPIIPHGTTASGTELRTASTIDASAISTAPSANIPAKCDGTAGTNSSPERRSSPSTRGSVLRYRTMPSRIGRVGDDIPNSTVPNPPGPKPPS